MNVVRFLRDAARHRLHRTCSRYLDARFVTPLLDAREPTAAYWEAVVERAGVELIEVIRVRADTRGVFLVRHPAHGRCVLKTVFAARHPGQGWANRAIADLVARAENPVFPRVYEATSEYTLEQYVDGRAFREWLHADFRPERIAAYFASLKAWSEAHQDDAGALMSPGEIREICRTTIAKCLNHARFFPTRDRVRSARRFYADGDGLAASIDWLGRAAERVRLPRGLMCGDMGNVNLIVQHGTNHIFNIDYEFMGPGHRGFDCAYFLSSLAKMGDPPHVLTSTRETILTEDYMGGPDSQEFFTVYTEVLSEISRTIYGAREPR